MQDEELDPTLQDLLLQTLTTKEQWLSIPPETRIKLYIQHKTLTQKQIGPTGTTGRGSKKRVSDTPHTNAPKRRTCSVSEVEATFIGNNLVPKFKEQFVSILDWTLNTEH